MPANSEPPPVADSEQELLGAFDNGQLACSGDIQGMLSRTQTWGRAAAISSPFATCMFAAIGQVGTQPYGASIGQYRKCNGDPFYSEDPVNQATRAIQAARSLNNVRHECSTAPLDGNASAAITLYEHINQEGILWDGPWLNDIYSSLANPLCSQPGGAQPCRWAPHPYPYPNLAGPTWHEAMHTHGYTHGADDQANAIIACGYAQADGSNPDPTWNFQMNTIPYITEHCIYSVLSDSYAACGNPDQGCGAGYFRVLNRPNGTAADCVCVKDPGWSRAGTANTGDTIISSAAGMFRAWANKSRIDRWDAATNTWIQVGGAGRQWVATDSYLYGVTPDGTQVWRYNNSPWSWTRVDLSTNVTLIAGGANLFAVREGAQNVYRYYPGATPSWVQIGTPGRFFVANRESLYGVTPNATEVWRYAVASGSWTRVYANQYGTVENAYAGGTAFFVKGSASTALYRLNGSSYANVGTASGSWVVNDYAAYRLIPDQTAVWRFDLVSGSAETIYYRASAIFAGGPHFVVRRKNDDGTDNPELLRRINP